MEDDIPFQQEDLNYITERQEKELLDYLHATLDYAEVIPGFKHYVIENLSDFTYKFIKKLEEIGYERTGKKTETSV